jgi:hypothetical protein
VICRASSRVQVTSPLADQAVGLGPCVQNHVLGRSDANKESAHGGPDGFLTDYARGATDAEGRVVSKKTQKSTCVLVIDAREKFRGPHWITRGVNRLAGRIARESSDHRPNAQGLHLRYDVSFPRPHGLMRLRVRTWLSSA